MRLYIQRLEEQVRQLTGENEQLRHELGQMRAMTGLPATPAAESAAAGPSADPLAGQVLPGPGEAGPGAPPEDLGSISIARDDPLLAPDGFGTEAPIDLSVLAGGDFAIPPEPGGVPATPGQGPQDGPTQTAGLPGTPAPTSALSGSARDQYDLAYGYILTGDYDLAEQGFRAWLASFPQDPQAADAQYWLGESHLQQREYRDAASSFLAVYKNAPQGNKAPDSLMKLGMSLAALGEKNAACATLAEVANKYPNASQALMGRVQDEADKAGC